MQDVMAQQEPGVWSGLQHIVFSTVKRAGALGARQCRPGELMFSQAKFSG
jgi:hypothetical protein